MPLKDLTERERAVIALLERGMPDDEIAATLGLSAAAVRCEVIRARRKLGVSRRADIVRMVVIERVAAEFQPFVRQ